MLNRTVLVGRLTKDPELRYLPNGTAVCSFTLAVNRQFTNQQGEREADFIQCVVWRRAAENTANFVKKGSLVGVDGWLQTRSYDNNEGRRQYITEVVCDSVQFLETKREQSAPPSAPQPNTAPQTNSAEDNDPFANGQPIDIADDDLPF